VVGAVLAGGDSRRMGEPKALVVVDGVPMGSRVASALSDGGCRSVTLVGGDPAWHEALGLLGVADRWPGLGPLAGTTTALLDVADQADEAAVVVVAACDQPWLDAGTVGALLDALDARPDVDVAVPLDPDGRTLPFPAAWRARVAPVLRDLVEAGERRAGAGPAAVRWVGVPVVHARVADVDRPADLRPDS
jgi:molybdopterin-guanine dinucleotide biosynthesis protein A